MTRITLPASLCSGAAALLLGACAAPPQAPLARDAATARQTLAQAELALRNQRLDEAALLLEKARAQGHEPAAVARRQSELAASLGAAQGMATVSATPVGATLAAPAAAAPAALRLGAAFQRPVSLEFRDTPLRQVFEALARASGVNFVFDREVRADSRVTVFLRSVSLDEAMRVILATQQLDRKLLNENTVLVYPNTAPKQREHQELVTRTLYLANADPKQALALVRTMAKTRDLHVDERLSALVVRDTPEVVRLVEQLIATIDLPEPEVMLAIEVLELSGNRLDTLGVDWPASVSYALPGAAGAVQLGASGLRGFVANPALVAQLRGTSGTTRILANPSIRARNREKARVQIGEKLPVFTTTAVANAGVSASVSFIDVGLKLEVEPTVQLDGEVTIRLQLEVSNLLREVRGPAGSASLAYQVGTRSSATALRLRDGQTQVLAGLISDEDRRSAAGLPGLARLPLLGPLFGVHSDGRNQSEIVMLVTPYILRALPAPPPQQAMLASGTESHPGASALRLQPGARVGVGASSGAAAASSSSPARPGAEASPRAGALVASATQTPLRVGDTAAVTLSNRSGTRARGELQFDASQLQAATAEGAAQTPGRWPFDLAPGAEMAFVVRVLPGAAGQGVGLFVSSDVPVEGELLLNVQAAAGAPTSAPATAPGTAPSNPAAQTSP